MMCTTELAAAIRDMESQFGSTLLESSHIEETSPERQRYELCGLQSSECKTSMEVCLNENNRNHAVSLTTHDPSSQGVSDTSSPTLKEHPRQEVTCLRQNSNQVQINVVEEATSVDSLQKQIEKLRSDLEAAKQEAKLKGKTVRHLQRRVHVYESASSARANTARIHLWQKNQPILVGSMIDTAGHGHLGSSVESIREFADSEKHYLNTLQILDCHFYQPLKMLSAFKPDIVSFYQLNAIFGNCSQLLSLHKLLHESLCHIMKLPSEVQLEEFLVLLERHLPSFSVYSTFMSHACQQLAEREIRQCRGKPQFSRLLEQLEKKSEGRRLQQLLLVPSSRISEYITLLSGFLKTNVGGLTDGASDRIDEMIRFLKNIDLDLATEKCDWEFMVEKVKLLQKLAPDGPIPLELFDTNTKLVKQGPVLMMLNGKEIPRHCILFSNYVAMADKTPDQHYYVFQEGAMISLVGATLHKDVDMGGQVIEKDLHSGLQQDRLAFRVDLGVQDSLILKVAKPNELKFWLESFEKCIEETQRAIEDTDSGAPPTFVQEFQKIAAASLQKLFQQLTNPQIACRDDFIEVFLTTYPCFTTSLDVLTALLNCINRDNRDRTPEPSSVSNPINVFTFTMEENDTSETSSMSTSVSLQNISSSESDSDSPMHSPTTPRKQVLNSKVAALISPVQRQQLSSKRTSTSDSDSSPYTSGVPVIDHTITSGKDTQNGWQDMELSIKGSLMRVTGYLPCDANSPYVAFTNPQNARQLSHESVSGYDSEGEDVDIKSGMRAPYYHSHSPSPAPDLSRSYSTSPFPEQPGKVGMTASLSTSDLLENEWESLDLALKATQDGLQEHSDQVGNATGHDIERRQSLLTEDLDRANDLMSSVLVDLNVNKQELVDECFGPEEDEQNFHRYSSTAEGRVSHPGGKTGRRRHNTDHSSEKIKLSSSSLSLSQPDLTVNSIRTPTHHHHHLPKPAVNDLTASLPQGAAKRLFGKTDYPSASLRRQHSATNKSRTADYRFLSKLRPRKSDKRKLEQHMATLSVESQASALYFGSPEPQSKHSSPSRSFKGIFKKRRESHRPVSHRGSMVDPESSGLKGLKRSSTFQRYPTDILSPPTPRRERMSDGSPYLPRKQLNYSSLGEKIFIVLNKWIHMYFEDFTTNPELMNMLKDFLKDTESIDSIEGPLARQTLHMVETLEYNRMTTPSFSQLVLRAPKLVEAPQEESCELDKATKLAVGSCNVELWRSRDGEFLRRFAEQLTLMEYSCFCDIQRSELLHCQWKKKDKDKLAPNVQRLIYRTNEMTSWVCTEILSQETVSARAAVIENLVQTAWRCYKHNDMHCSLNIAIALGSAPIKRLKKTWDAMDRKCKSRFEKLKEVTDHGEKCKKLRERLEQVTKESLEKTDQIPACLPYVGAYLDQIYTLEISVKSYNDDGLVNFAKMTKLANLIDSVLRYKKTPYKFEQRLDMITYVTNAKRLSENELYDLSLKREPR